MPTQSNNHLGGGGEGASSDGDKPTSPSSPKSNLRSPISDLHHTSSHRLLVIILLAFGFFVAIALAALITYSLTKPKAPEIITQQTTTTPLPTLQPTQFPDSTANWQTYTDPATGFTLRYPNEIELNSPYERISETMQLNISSFPFDNLASNSFSTTTISSADLNQDYQTLSNGNFGNSWQVDYTPARQVINHQGHNIKLFTLYQANFDACGIEMKRVAFLYPDEKHYAIISLRAPVKFIIAENPSYFTEQPIDQYCWDTNNDNAVQQFHQAILADQLSNHVKIWLQTHDQILSTLKFTN